MPVTDVRHDLDALTLTITAEFAAPVERVWEVYADPRQLERVWGPPTYPATFVDHDLPRRAGDLLHDQPRGREVLRLLDRHRGGRAGRLLLRRRLRPRRHFTPDPDLPVSRNTYTFTEVEGGTRATYVGTYASAEGLQQVLDMGAVEGASSAINQIDDLLA